MCLGRHGRDLAFEEEHFAAEVDALLCCGFGSVGFDEELCGADLYFFTEGTDFIAAGFVDLLAGLDVS